MPRKAVARALLATMIFLSTQGCKHTITQGKFERPKESFEYCYVEDIGNDFLNLKQRIESFMLSQGYQVIAHKGSSGVQKAKARPAVVTGSGFFVNDAGFAVTNNHVVDGYRFVSGQYNGLKFPGKVIAIDKTNDLAVVEFQGIKNDRWLSIGDSNSVKIGMEIYALGFPMASILGETARITNGIVNSPVGIQDDPGTFQISAPIQPGNSGGPVIDKNATVIGVAVSTLSPSFAYRHTSAIPQNVNFAVKSNTLKTLLYSKSIDTNKPSQSKQVLDDKIMSAIIMIKSSDSEDTSAIGKQKKTGTIKVTYKYHALWDVFHYTFMSLSMSFIDEESGAIISSVNYSGPSFSSWEGQLESIFKDLRHRL